MIKHTLHFVSIISLILLTFCEDETSPNKKIFNSWQLVKVSTTNPISGTSSTYPTEGWILTIEEDTLTRYQGYGTGWNSQNQTISAGWYDSTIIERLPISLNNNTLFCDSLSDYDYSFSTLYDEECLILKTTEDVILVVGGNPPPSTITQQETYLRKAGILPPDNWPPVKVGK